MNRFGKYAIVAFSLVLFHAFGSGKTGEGDKVDVVKYKGHKVVIGTETSNTNLRDETIILHSGEVFSHNKVSNEYKYQKKLSRGDVHRIFGIIDRAPITSFNHPGTNSSFIEEYNGTSVTNYYMWGDPDVKVPEYILEDYTEILKIAK